MKHIYHQFEAGDLNYDQFLDKVLELACSTSLGSDDVVLMVTTMQNAQKRMLEKIEGMTSNIMGDLMSKLNPSRSSELCMLHNPKGVNMLFIAHRR